MISTAGTDTSLELNFDTAPGGHAIVCERTVMFDPHSGIQHTPALYASRPMEPVPDAMPSEKWVADAFTMFVRGEFGQSRSTPQAPAQPKLLDGPLAHETDVILDYLVSCEQSLVYDGVAAAIAREAGASMSAKLFAILTHPLLGNSTNGKHLTTEGIDSLIAEPVERKQRLRFVMPAFPFKDQNAFRCIGPPGHVDLGEVAMLIRLHTLSMAMYQVHPFGADWIILSDGLAYASILRIDPDDCKLYFEKLRYFRNLLDIGGSVSILDLKTLTERLVSDSGNANIFREAMAVIADMIRSAKDEDPQMRPAFDVLKRGMKRNMNLQDLCGGVPWVDWWQVIHSSQLDELDSSMVALWREVDDLATDTAVEYAAFNLCIRYLSVIDRILPGTLRATVHPKPNQIAVPSLGREFPWNAMAVVKGPGVTIDSLESMPLHRLGPIDAQVTRHNSANGAPFYCRIASDAM